jgi:uncharacterized phage protein gp47/JayE
MPWETPTLRQVRSLVRDSIRASLPGADALVPNSVLRVLSDNQGALCHLNLQYQDWLARQLMPDSAEVEWLDRHGDIWLVNADGTTGRKMATLAQGTVEITSALFGITVPAGTRLLGAVGTVEYETLADVITAPTAVPVEVRALDPGTLGNLDAGTALSVETIGVSGITATSVDVSGGVDEESDDDLRIRVLERIRQPPQGGALHDYVRWAKAVPGCTRAWCYPLEMGIGTVTVRVMFDELRADNDGFPLDTDLAAVEGYIDTVRPVAVKDHWVLAPLKQRIEFYINDLTPDTSAVRAAIEVSLREMLLNYAAPGRTIYAAWKYQAISSTPEVVSFAMATALDDIMPSPGHIATLGDIVYGAGPPQP